MLALAFAFLVPLLTTAAVAASADSGRPLVPPPAPTAVLQTWTAVSSGPATNKPPPKPVRFSVPKLPSPLSPPVAAAPQSGKAAPASVTLSSPPAATPPLKPNDNPPVGDHRNFAASTDEPVIRYAATEINVRPRPDPDARRIDVIDEGTRLEVFGPLIHNTWVKVARHGRPLGYVSAEYLLPRPPKPH